MPVPSVRDCESHSASLVALGAKRGRIRQMLREKAFASVYQPILDLGRGGIVGFEGLTRFASEPYRTPDLWFGDAGDVGLGNELELQTLKAALRECADLPAHTFVALNVSPDALLGGWIPAVLKAVNPARLVLELTEHAPVADYAALQAVLQPLRERGVRIAIDDVGSGYANLQHILQLRPDILKLDVGLTRDVDLCPARATLIHGLIEFSRTLGCDALAEGVETPAQLATLRALGTDMVQGYLVGRPEAASRYGLKPR